jgi:hypothetical protein
MFVEAEPRRVSAQQLGERGLALLERFAARRDDWGGQPTPASLPPPTLSERRHKPPPASSS